MPSSRAWEARQACKGDYFPTHGPFKEGFCLLLENYISEFAGKKFPVAPNCHLTPPIDYEN